MKKYEITNIRCYIFGFLLLLFILAAILIYANRQKTYKQEEASHLLSNIQKNIELQLQENLNYTDRLEAVVIADPKEVKGFDLVAEEIMNQPGVRYIELIQNNQLTHIYPFEPYRSYLGSNYSQETYSYVLSVMTKELVISGPLPLKGDIGEGFLFILPIYTTIDKIKTYWGEAAVALEKQSVVNALGLNQLFLDGFNYELWQVQPLEGKKRVIDTSSTTIDFSNSIEIKFNTPTTWTLSIIPAGGWYNENLLTIHLTIGLLIVILSTALLFNIHHKRLARQSLNQISLFDLETGFYSRDYLIKSSESWIVTPDHPFTLFYIIIHGYNRIIQMGGEELKADIINHIRTVLKNFCQNDSFIGRIGECNFILAVHQSLTASEISDQKKEMAIELTKPILVCGKNEFLTSGFGASSFPSEGTNLPVLLDKAIMDYHINVQSNNTLNDIILKCTRLMNGDSNVFFGQYANPPLDKLAKILTRYKNKMEQTAYIDAMLGIGNRIKYLRDIETLVSYDEKRPFCLYLIDIAEFSKFNGLFSVEIGDKILKEICKRLSNIFHNYLYRVGGDVFLGIILSECLEQGVLYNLQNSIAMNFNMNNMEFELQYNIGICHYPDHGSTPAELLENCRVALRYAKADQNVSIISYNDSLSSTLRWEETVLNLLNKSVTENTLEVWYQPIYYLKEKAFIKAEALLRLKDENGGYISPYEAILIAEKNRMMEKIGEYVLRTSCQTMETISHKSTDLKQIQVNISVQQLMVKDYAEKVIELIHQMGILPNQISFEITETMLIQSFDRTIEILNQLKQAGIQIILDDFGSGYSSLTYLSNLPIDILKLDMSLTKQAVSSKKQYSLLKAIVQMAQTNDILIVAEGVETKEELDVIASSGVDAIQGYYFSKPLNEKEFFKFMEQSTKEHFAL